MFHRLHSKFRVEIVSSRAVKIDWKEDLSSLPIHLAVKVSDVLFLPLLSDPSFQGLLTLTPELSEGGLMKTEVRTSPVVQRLRIHLPMQGTQVQSLVWEDSTCCGMTKPLPHNN